MSSKAVGTMVFCLACRTVIWAHDSGHWGDVRGLLNAMRMPCRLCGGENEFRGYDGWTITAEMVRGYGLPDVWLTMHQLAEDNGLAWDNSPDLTWFSRKEDRCTVCRRSDCEPAAHATWTEFDAKVGAWIERTSEDFFKDSITRLDALLERKQEDERD